MESTDWVANKKLKANNCKHVQLNRAEEEEEEEGVVWGGETRTQA